jgi:ribosomal protein L23
MTNLGQVKIGTTIKSGPDFHMSLIRLKQPMKITSKEVLRQVFVVYVLKIRTINVCRGQSRNIGKLRESCIQNS